MKTTRILSLMLALLLMLMCALSCTKEEPNDVWKDATYTENKSLGEGAYTLTITVTAEERSVMFTVKTDAANVKDALYAHGLIDGDRQSAGFMVSHVNGIRADWTLDGAYWAFYDSEGSYMMTGVDATTVEGDAAYAFVYTPA